jgi:hypothetical protein
VLADGLPAPSYQWQSNAMNIPGALSARYTTPVLTAADNGTSYNCVAANSAGSTNSDTAVLGVMNPTPNLTVPSIGDGQFQAQLQGSPGRSYLIQTTQNLNTWSSLRSITLSNSSLDFTDSFCAAVPFRAYRAELLP